MYPKPLVDGFWKEVLRLLVEEYGISQPLAKKGIANHRLWWKDHAGDDEGVIYNGGEERVAESIANGIKNNVWYEPKGPKPGKKQTRGIA